MERPSIERWVETEACVHGMVSESYKISLCKSCLKPNYITAICPSCGIKNWIGKDFLNNPNSIRKIENWWGIPHGQFIPLFKSEVIRFKLEMIKEFIRRIK